MRNAIIVIAFVLVLTACVRHAPERSSFRYSTDDLIFQDLDCGELCDAIEMVTKRQFSVDGPELSHVGIIIEREEGVYVLEALGGDVALQPLTKVLSRSQNTRPIFLTLSLEDRDRERIKRIAGEYIGRPYDDRFIYGDDRYYCSELVYDVLKEVKPSLKLSLLPMYFGERGSKEHSVWLEYYRKLGEMTIPENEPGISPLGLLLQIKSDLNRY